MDDPREVTVKKTILNWRTWIVLLRSKISSSEIFLIDSARILTDRTAITDQRLGPLLVHAHARHMSSEFVM